MEHEDFEFDAGLKVAVQRAWSGETAPQRLRGRISRIVTTASSINDATAAATARPSPWQRWQSQVYAFAAAAVLILSVALLALYYQGTFDTPRIGYATPAAMVVPSKTQVPLTLTRSMLATHTACGKLHDHRLVDGVDGVDTYAALNIKLTADLGFPALARSIGQDWRFKGAGECTVGDSRGAHLLFARGDQTVSVFALPGSCMSGMAPGAQYEGMVDGSPVAGFARSGALYGVVGTSPGNGLSLDAIKGIRDGLFIEFDLGCGEDFAEPEYLY